MDRFIGRMLDDRYEILEVIGTGGMAVVYKARCHRLNRLVAIKILKDENVQDAEFRRRFRAEGQAVGMLNHPNIVAVYDVVASKETDYIVMELVDGISLKQYMEKKGVLNWKETVHFATQIAKALEHAHSKGLVHRDIKPHNVMVLKNGGVRVTDFGIARVTSKASTMTKEALGSVHYISPEQAKGSKVDCRSDLYSLGVVMYEMITGRPPFDGESPVSVALQHIAGGATNPSVLNPNIPAALEQIIMKAMAKDAKDRYANAAALLADLDAVRKDPTILFPEEHMRPAPKKPVKPEPAQEEKVPPKKKTEEKTAAEKAVQKKTPAKPAKSREERSLNRNRIATVVIVLCALAVMAAVIVFLGTGMGNTQQTQPKMVKVPTVVGMHYERLPDYDVVIVKQSTSYSEEYGKGVIMRQLPEAGTSVEVGSKVFVVVSLGKEPATVVMPDLLDMTEAEARMMLNSLNMGLKITTTSQSHDSVPKGYVISVTPAKDTVLWQGATVTLCISEGKEIRTAEMPNLLQGAATYKAAAEAEMNRRGFTNVTWVPVERSDQPEGKILSQSVPAKTKVDVNAPITIEYAVKPAKVSKMPNLLTMHIDTAKRYMDMLGFINVRWIEVENSAPYGTVLSQSVDANTMISVSKEIVVEYSDGLAVDPVTIPVTIDRLPISEEVQYLSLVKVTDGQFEFVYTDLELAIGQTSITVELTDISVQKYEVWVDGRKVQTITVDFGTDEPTVEQPDPEEPGIEEPEPSEPGTEEPGTEQPGTEEPGMDQVEDGE